MNIKDFQFETELGNRFIPNITPNIGDSLFEYVSDDLYKEYVNKATKGLFWVTSGSRRAVNLYESGVSIFGIPTPDMQRVIVIYPMEHTLNRAPRNAIIYNADGSVHRILNAPEPISDLAKTRSRFMAKTKAFNPPHRLYFHSVRWVKAEGEIVTVVGIGFDRDWQEERILNPETGKFGECVSSGMR